MATSRRQTSQRLTLLILVVASITAITLDYRGPTSRAIGSLRNGARDALSPVQHVFSDVFRPVGDFFAGAVDYSTVSDDNAVLRRQLGDLRRQALEDEGAEQQLQEVLSLERLPFLQNSKDVLADVVSGPSSNYELTFEIDRGTADGVADGMPVVSGAGLVGTVIASAGATAVVRLVTDPSSDVGIRFPDGTIATVVGQGLDDPLAVQNLPASAPSARRGQLVVTSGVEGGAFPADIPVGTVSAVRSSNGSFNQDVAVKPVADLSALQYVAVIQWLPAA